MEQATALIGKRTVHCTDALVWLEAQKPLAGCSLVSSMPDFSEFPSKTLTEWKDWFVNTAALILSRCPDEGVTIFYQTDIKNEGAWVDKAYLCQKAAEREGHELLWHKIICRTPPDSVTFGRPAYSHMLCFSKGVRANLEKSTTDVMAHRGEVSWARGMGVQACVMACRFVLEGTATRTIVNPFCGHGTVLAVANELGLDAVGIELSRKRAERAQALQAPQFRLR